MTLVSQYAAYFALGISCWTCHKIKAIPPNSLSSTAVRIRAKLGPPGSQQEKQILYSAKVWKQVALVKQKLL